LVNGLHVAGLVIGERGAEACQDRASIVPVDDGLVLVLADGAGGLGGGALAAHAVVAAVTNACANNSSNVWTAAFWVEVLGSVDAQVAASAHGGQSTAVVCAVGREMVGASVGDSIGWLVDASGVSDLTAGQSKRPLVGSGQAVVAAIASELGTATLLLASDGLARYACRAKIAAIAISAELAESTGRLVALVRLRSGALHDDVSVLLCRRERQSTG
jgi:serine/threonine protein phosphatase PrpC